MNRLYIPKPKTLRYLPIEPLRPFLRTAAADLVSNWDPYNSIGLRQLSRRFAVRFDMQPGSARRQLDRIMSHRCQQISVNTADEWCLVLGIHPANVWPEEWFDDEEMMA